MFKTGLLDLNCEKIHVVLCLWCLVLTLSNIIQGNLSVVIQRAAGLLLRLDIVLQVQDKHVRFVQ